VELYDKQQISNASLIRLIAAIQFAAQKSRLSVEDIVRRQIIQLNGEPEGQKKVKSKAPTVRRTGIIRNRKLTMSDVN
jgi:hypothetical protein